MNEMNEFELDEKKTNGKGFYIALAICVVAVCGIAVTTFMNSLAVDQPKENQTTTTTTAISTTTTTQTAKPVVKPQGNVPDTRTTTKATTTTVAAKPLYLLPSSNRVLRSFSELHAYSETLGAWVTHNGVDFTAEIDSAVKAVADGKVKAVYEDALWGHILETEHEGNLIIRYCGMESAVKAGQSIKAGETIGKVSEIPAEITDASHLHLEMIVNGKYMDPLTLIEGKTVKEAS